MLFRPILLCLLSYFMPVSGIQVVDRNPTELRPASQQYASARTLGARGVQTPRARVFDEFAAVKLTEAFSRRPSPSRTRTPQGACKDCDLKARLDNLAIQLQNEPEATSYLITLKPRRATLSKEQEKDQEVALNRAKDYLVNTRGIDAGRIVTFVGLEGKDSLFQLWIVPPGARSPLP